MLWQQLEFGLIYGLVRILATTTGERQSLLWGLIAASMIVAIYGWYQYLVELPALHRSYLNEDEAGKLLMLQQAGVTEVSPGSRMRQLFESRLFNREPFAFFSLANSLAGVLVPGVVLSFGFLWQSVRDRKAWLSGLWVLAWILLGSALLLTSSRTGILTVSFMMAGFVLVQLLGAPGWGRAGRWMPAAVFLLPVAGALVLWIAGWSDRRLLSSAPASIRYRLEYWISSLQMVVDRPWFGSHPGSFQSLYAKYQLPSASETVSDPHNLLMEWMATAGAPAALAMLVAMGATVRLAMQRSEDRPMESLVVSRNARGWLTTSGLLLGWVVAGTSNFLFGFMGGTGLSDLVALLGTFIAIVWYWAILLRQPAAAGSPQRADLLRTSVVFAWAALVVHLMASGGVNYPAIGQWVFVLTALLATPPAVAVRHSMDRATQRWLVVLGGGLTLLAGYLYYYQLAPRVESSSIMTRAESLMQRGRPELATPLFQQALEKNPSNSEAAFLLASSELMQNLAGLNDKEVQQDVERHFRKAMQLEPVSAPARLAVAQQYLNALRLIDSQGVADRSAVRTYLLRQAAGWLERAIERKPVDPQPQILASWVAWELGDGEQSRRLATEVRELASRFSHQDQGLENTVLTLDRESARRLIDAGAPVRLDPTSGISRLSGDQWVDWRLSLPADPATPADAD